MLILCKITQPGQPASPECNLETLSSSQSYFDPPEFILSIRKSAHTDPALKNTQI